jgi:type VI secretion system VasD/TssJ family lipoprotein
MARLNHFFAAAVVSALTFGCGGAPPPPAAAAPAKPCQALPLQLAFTATPRSNALSTGEGRPVQLQILQLKSDARLRTASFEDIWQNGAKTLEGELVSSEQHTLFPGEKKTVTVAPKPDASYVAIVALFREPQGKDWFLTYEIAPPKSQPPCETKSTPIPIWVDRMQVQDGAGREGDGQAEGASGEPSPTKDDGVKGF